MPFQRLEKGQMIENQEDKEFEHVLALIQNAKGKAYQSVNHIQILLYWQIGEYVHERLSKAVWGSNTIQKLAFFLQNKDPLLTNFNKRSLYRMQQFFVSYPDFEFVSTVSTQISWSHHLDILSGTKGKEEREYYTKLSIKDRLNVRDLRRQLKSGHFERSIIADKLLPSAFENYPKDVTGVLKIHTH